jgi:hypothetical protein|tara:strand:+ start:3365 stop:3697 length:333 start_codon:yes stop_codon:yes gene_type:complete
VADKYFHQRLIPSAATETVIYTVPAANTGIVKSLRITNADGSSSNISVKQYDAAAGTAVFLYKEQSLAANATVEILAGVPLIVEEANVLKVISSQANVTFYLSYLEVDRD